MESFTTQDLIEELQQYHQSAVPRRTTEKGEPCGVTTQELAEAEEYSETAARKYLKKLMAKGVLEREWTISQNGVRSFVYYRIEK